LYAALFVSAYIYIEGFQASRIFDKNCSLIVITLWIFKIPLGYTYTPFSIMHLLYGLLLAL